MLCVEFARDASRAHFTMVSGTNLDETQAHVFLGFAPIPNVDIAVGPVSDGDDVQTSEEVAVGLMFFRPESIDSVIRGLTQIKEELLAKLEEEK